MKGDGGQGQGSAEESILLKAGRECQPFSSHYTCKRVGGYGSWIVPFSVQAEGVFHADQWKRVIEDNKILIFRGFISA